MVLYQRTRRKNTITGGKKNIVTSFGTGGSSFDATSKVGFAECSDWTHPGPPYKSGGPLLIRKRYVSMVYTPETFYSKPYSSFKGWRGQFYAAMPGDPFPSTFSLAGWGAKGWNRALPVKPAFNAGQFLYELKDVGRMFKSTYDFFHSFRDGSWKGKSPEFWADQYLNNSFGWMPFVSDWVKIVSLPDTLERQRRFLIKNNGRSLPRRVNLLDQSDSSRTSSGPSVAGGLLPLLNFTNTDQSISSESEKVETYNDRLRVWFEGVFRFHIPESELWGGHDYLLLAKLTGLYPDLNLLWEITPWSWLVDYFASVGPVLANISYKLNYGQVAEYAYIMAHREVRREVTATCNMPVGLRPTGASPIVRKKLTARSLVIDTISQREAASPYGFGLTWEGFTPYQLSILAALGLSRGRYHF